ncbi:metalloregulator ArsR/SmtB family transcription factor [Caulobacter sp. BE254]|uniref:ArsR/SmtB family transcription factor n=2 Tax=unclassified Caulobacter TaxID=2648921 RepID=UPI0028589CA4|nr:metalloregulator ArsR/SmtB family transcription factor [Caulobacter sp. BE254]MDR7115662.1 DNA-binding transcriptional ArsR family regulator [Caulobacter sp. BE254]
MPAAGETGVDAYIYACKCICMETQINIFHALGDPTRLRIVEAMKSGECAVGDIVERMDIHQSGVSRHLRILTEAGVVRMRPDGQKRLYSLRQEAFDQLEAWVADYRRHWEARLDRFGAALERNRAAEKTADKEDAQ